MKRKNGQSRSLSVSLWCAPDMLVNQEMKVLHARIQIKSIRRKQLRRREAPWAGSWSQNGEPTNRNVL